MLLKARNICARCVLFILREYARCKTASGCYVLCACARKKAVPKGHNLREPVFNGSAHLGGFDLQIKY